MKKTLWTRNFRLVTLATALGAAGGIAGSFGLSFLVFDETGSTLAAALIQAVGVAPYLLIPLLVAPWMDRLPRKPFLVGGDLVCGMLYALAGVYLLHFQFSYGMYLVFSLVLASLSAFDELAYNSIYPQLIPEGMEEKGYAVSAMLYPVLRVVMTPLAGVLMDTLGVAWLLIIQAALSLLAALVESGIRLEEHSRLGEAGLGFRVWWADIREAWQYLGRERGLRNIFAYMAVTNGVAAGYSPLLVAFFRTTPGLTTAMYGLFSLAEFLGRSVGGAFHYTHKMDPKRKFGFTFLVYQTYEAMDMCLLWLPYPWMLVNRGICGFLGMCSATVRQAAVQRYIPETLRARVNAFDSVLIMAASSLLSLAVGALGTVMDYRLALTLCGAFSAVFCWLTIWRSRKAVRGVYEAQGTV